MTRIHITPEQMRQRYNAIKAIDPHRITTQADPLRVMPKRYRPYALYSDNFSPEIYPVHNDSKEDMDRVVPTVISTMKAIRRDVEAVKAPTRSCWPLIQYFYNCGRWRRLQTKEELRSMGYQAIIHGAQGVIWYRYAGYGENLKTGFTAEQWQVVVEVSRELRSLYDVLCQRAAAVQPPQPEVLSGAAFDCLDNPSVSLLLKRRQGIAILLRRLQFVSQSRRGSLSEQDQSSTSLMAMFVSLLQCVSRRLSRWGCMFTLLVIFSLPYSVRPSGTVWPEAEKRYDLTHRTWSLP